MAWTGFSTVHLAPVGCGGSIHTPHGTGKRYPHPDEKNGIGVSFTNRGCR
jgi:hypothetical protein